jgi:4-diphosphocytidyl-2-C-methyl-D-erythritol kinase
MTATPAENWSVWPAPAKLNLWLQIVGRRADGFHELQTVFQLLDWGDEVRLRVRADGRIESAQALADVPAEADLTVRAARALQRATAARWGAELAVDKRIPFGGGVGGGSSDAATTLVALNELWETSLNVDDLASIGAELGADVPVFVRGHSAWAEGIGERLVALPLPKRWFLLVDCGICVPTAQLFQAPELTRDAPSAKIADFVSGQVRGNAFEPVLRRRAPQVAAVLDRLAEVGDARLTGTGGGSFVAFDDPASAERARETLPAGWRCWIAEGVDRSPLLQRLDGWRAARARAGAAG